MKPPSNEGLRHFYQAEWHYLLDLNPRYDRLSSSFHLKKSQEHHA